MAENSVKWDIGIDFGTSYNYVFGWKKNGNFKDFLKNAKGKAVKIADSFKEGQYGVESLYSDKGIGRNASDCIVTAGSDDIKTIIRHMEKFDKDNDGCKNAISFFSNLFYGLDEFPCLTDIENIVVGVPCITEQERNIDQEGCKNSGTNIFYRGNISKIMALSLYYNYIILPLKIKNKEPVKNDHGKLKVDYETLYQVDEKNIKIIEDKIKCVDEPILAGYAYFVAAEVSEINQILVIDGGGGTIDLAHIAKSANGIVHSCALRGGDEPAGSAVTDSLGAYMANKLGVEPTKIPRSYVEAQKRKLFEKQDVLGNDISDIDNIGLRFNDPNNPEDTGDNTYLILQRKQSSVDNIVKSWKDENDSLRKYYYMATDGVYEGVDDSDIISEPVKKTIRLIDQMYPCQTNQTHIDQVLFTGGMSHIADYRDRVINSLTTKNYFSKNNENVLYPVREKGNIVNERIKGTRVIGGITLTSSNIVALGACIVASNKYFAIENEDDIYVGTYDATPESYSVHMLGDIYIRFGKEGNGSIVEFPLFEVNKTCTDCESAVLIQDIANYNASSEDEDIIWKKVNKQKVLRFRITVKSDKNTSEILRSFPCNKDFAVKSVKEDKKIKIKADDVGLDKNASCGNDLTKDYYYTVTIKEGEECSLLFSLKNFVLNIYVLPFKDIKAFSSEDGLDFKKLSVLSCCIV